MKLKKKLISNEKCQQKTRERGKEKRSEPCFKSIAKETQRISTRAGREHETCGIEEKGFCMKFYFI